MWTQVWNLGPKTETEVFEDSCGTVRENSRSTKSAVRSTWFGGGATWSSASALLPRALVPLPKCDWWLGWIREPWSSHVCAIPGRWLL